MANDSTWADPAPLGFAGLASITLMFSLIMLGKIPTSEVPLLVAVGVTGGLAQFTTGIILFKKGNVPAGNLFATFGTLFMIAPGLMVFLHGIGVTDGISTMLGSFNVLLGVFLLIWVIPLLRAPWVEFLIGPIGGVTLITAGLGHLTTGALSARLTTIGGYLFIVLTLWGLWMMAHHLGKATDFHIPIGSPILGKKY
ncbi:GPR1/FUN34/YaaH family transporter [Methanohalophilus sp. RSK]|uniref:GPR1/FUN34/YaaH family transporter n=1 Tax=Methanohalophilus sp. RSK TaxID=2485783 RepID=UPI001314E500|nr:GPR1/FUN34/YaaH family transporter [Methanohalophilus sp. RSK]